MSVVLGIDAGGSTTKVAGFAQGGLIGTLQVRAADQVTSIYGAVGRFLLGQGMALESVSEIFLTGVGASFMGGDIYGIPARKTDEFQAIGFGGARLSGLESALVVSLGTGSAFVRVSPGKAVHIGGSGVGGGSLLGLSSKLINLSDIEAIAAVAENGDLSKVDLSVREICGQEIPHLPPHTTASNFGKISSLASKGDMALGLINMVFQTVGMLAVFACLNDPVKDVVITGSLTVLPQAKEVFDAISALYNINFTIPRNAVFATAIGAVYPRGD